MDPQDQLHLDGRRVGADDAPPARGPRTPFLSIWFRCCHMYGRLYRNADATAYAGRCPRCGAAVQAAIGAGGTSKRMFEAS